MAKKKKRNQDNQSINSVINETNQNLLDEQKMANSMDVSGSLETDYDNYTTPLSAEHGRKNKKKTKNNKYNPS